MTQQVNNKATLTTPVDLKKDQVDETRRVLEEMWDKADRAIDEQTGRSTREVATPMSLSGVKRTWPVAAHMSAYDPKRT